ncbi:MAG: hypothetical protein ACHQ0Y_14540 [Thermodesulfovibrionales bacterium]
MKTAWDRRFFESCLFAFFAVFILFTQIPISSAGEYFSCDQMDHFASESSCAQAQTARRAAAQQQNSTGKQQENGGFTKEQIELWAEPTVDSSGKVISKLPPLPVLRALADPTPENAQAYIEWNKKRADALSKFVHLTSPGEDKTLTLQNVSEIKKVDFYFSPTCPYSMQQAPVVEGLAKKVGYTKVAAFTASTDIRSIQDFVQKTAIMMKIFIAPDRLSQNGVTAVPVTIIETIDGRKLRYDGFTDNFIGSPSGQNAADTAAGISQSLSQGNNQGGKQQCGAK